MPREEKLLLYKDTRSHQCRLMDFFVTLIFPLNFLFFFLSNRIMCIMQSVVYVMIHVKTITEQLQKCIAMRFTRVCKGKLRELLSTSINSLFCRFESTVCNQSLKSLHAFYTTQFMDVTI